MVSEESVAEPVNEIEEGVGETDGLSCGREHVYGIKRSGQKRKRHDDEVCHGLKMVEFCRPDSGEKPHLPQHQRAAEGEVCHSPWVFYFDGMEEPDAYDDAGGDGDSARRRAADESDGKFSGRERRHEEVGGDSHYLGNQQRRGGACEGILHEGHHCEPGDEEFGQGDVFDGGPGRAEGVGENEKEEERGDDRRGESLRGDFDGAQDFLVVKGGDSAPVNGAEASLAHLMEVGLLHSRMDSTGERGFQALSTNVFEGCRVFTLCGF